LAAKILPQKGRGTAREAGGGGVKCPGPNNHRAYRSIQILQNIARRDPHDRDTLGFQPGIAPFVFLGNIPAVMDQSVNLDCQRQFRAEEVQDIDSRRLLATEFESVWPLAQFSPQQHFGQRHCASQLGRAALCFGWSVDHDSFTPPPPPLAAVPLP
jgi:hypothetical protein